MAPRIGIVGIGHCRFGNSSDYDLVDVIAYSANEAFLDAGQLALRHQVD
jgi:acetyl-CoA acetyltransferase